MKLGEKISALREENGWSQQELGEMIDTHPRHISRWETGKSLPSADALIQISEVFNVSVDYLLFDDAPRTARSHVFDPELLKNLEEIEGLEESDRTALRKIIDALVAKKKLKQLAEEAG